MVDIEADGRVERFRGASSEAVTPRKGADFEIGHSAAYRLFSGDRLPAGLGGEPCIVRTRVRIWLLEQVRRLAASEHALLAAYPTLRAEDLVNAKAYVVLTSRK